MLHHRRRTVVEQPCVHDGIVGHGQRQQRRQLDGAQPDPSPARARGPAAQARQQDGRDAREHEQRDVLRPQRDECRPQRGEVVVGGHEAQRAHAENRERDAHGDGGRAARVSPKLAQRVQSQAAEDGERKDEQVRVPRRDRRVQRPHAREKCTDPGHAVHQRRGQRHHDREELRPASRPRGDECHRHHEPRHDADEHRDLVEIRRPPEVFGRRAAVEVRHDGGDHGAERQWNVDHPLPAIREHRAAERVFRERQQLHRGEQHTQRDGRRPPRQRSHGLGSRPRQVDGPHGEDHQPVDDTLRIAGKDRERHAEGEPRDRSRAATLDEERRHREQHRQQDHRARVRPLKPGDHQRAERERHAPDECRRPRDVEAAEKPVHRDARDRELEDGHQRERQRVRQDVEQRGEGKEHGRLRIREERRAPERVRVPQRKVSGADLVGGVDRRRVEEQGDLGQPGVLRRNTRIRAGPRHQHEHVVGRRHHLAGHERVGEDDEGQGQQRERGDDVAVAATERSKAVHAPTEPPCHLCVIWKRRSRL